jgi:hypothetical protein
MNPYASPSLSLSLPLQSRDNRDAAALAFISAMVLPMLYFWHCAAPLLAPQLPADLPNNLPTGLTLLLAAAATIPLGLAGIRSSCRCLALMGLSAGMIEFVLIYWVKFHPWVLRAIGCP